MKRFSVQTNEKKNPFINWVQDFYRSPRPCSSIERKYFGQLHVEFH